MNSVLFLLSLFLILHIVSCSFQDTVTMNKTIRDGDILVSKGSKFALGFFSPGKSSYRYLGIWFHKVPKLTAVWVANRNHPIKSASGVLSIDAQLGGLVLHNEHDSKNVPIWSTNVSMQMTETFVAQLLDSGNLVLLLERSRRIVWQSFDYPTDTALAGMKIGFDLKTGMQRFLTSWRSADDPGNGNYSLKTDQSALPQFLVQKGTEHIWRTHAWPWKTVSNLYCYSVVINEDEVYYTHVIQDDSIITRVVVTHWGSLMDLVWHETESRWKEFLSTPNYWCDVYGRCGPNSKCNFQSINFQCICLPGYEPKILKNWNLRDGSGGCKKKQSKSYSGCAHRESFVKLEQVKLPDTSVAVWLNKNMSLVDCERDCKRNCSCTAFAVVDFIKSAGGCLAWFGDLIDLEEFSDGGVDVYIRVDEAELDNLNEKKSSFLKMKGLVALLVSSAVSGWIAIYAVAYIWLKRRRRRRLLETITDSSHLLLKNEHDRQLDLEFFSIQTILAATNKFAPSNKLGQGGFGSVFKGQLPNGLEIAVKRLSKNSEQGFGEFKNELLLIAKLQHRNLVKLLGCCIHGGERMLIYEYLPNKSLDTFFLDPTKRANLDWKKRFEIIVGIARGVLYLHQDSRLTIIHRDLKSSNILLDAELEPKISDFGMARIFQGNQIQVQTNKVVGTYGYMSPEYAIFGKFSMKSDVFSFGIILLEIISGKKINGFHREEVSSSLIGYVWELWRQNKALEIMDSTLEQNFPDEEALRCIQVGLLCVQEDAMKRPSMGRVILMLNSQTNLPSPKKPAFVFRNTGGDSTNLSQTRNEKTCSINEMTISEIISR